MPPFVSTPTAWTPPTLSRNEAQALTTIAQRAMAMPLHCAGTDWNARLRPLFQVPRPSTAGDTTTCIEWAGAQLQLQLPEAAIEQMMSALLDGAALPHLPDEMQTVALAAALDELLELLERFGRGAPRLLTTHCGPPQEVLPHAFAVQLDAASGTQAIAGLLCTDSLGLLLLAGLAAGLPAHDGPLASTALPLKLQLTIGVTTLGIQELQQLAVGDVLLMERRFVATDRVLWLQAPGAGGLHVQLPAPSDLVHATATETAPDKALAEDAESAVFPAAPFLTVIQPWTHAMPDFETSMTEAAPIDAIQVRLSFDLGDIALTLGELFALQPGQAIRLEHPIASAVRIRANGTLVGEGALVEIDGHLGISVERLFAPHTTPAA